MFGTHKPPIPRSRRPSGPAGSRTRAAGLPNRRHPARPRAHSCRAQWNRGESNPAVARAKRNPRPRAAPVCEFQVSRSRSSKLKTVHSWNFWNVKVGTPENSDRSGSRTHTGQALDLPALPVGLPGRTCAARTVAGPGLEPGCRAYQTRPRARAPAPAEFRVPRSRSSKSLVFNLELWNLEPLKYSCGPGS